MQIALYYTYGDQDKARKMLSDSYRDIVILKGKFSSASVYGAFLIFVNSVYFKVAHSLVVVSKSFELSDLKTSVDWRNFERQLDLIQKKGGTDDIFSSQVKDNISKRLTIQELTKLVRLIEAKDEITLGHSFQKFLTDVTGFQNIVLSLDYEVTTSLAMELHSITSTKISPAELAKGQSMQAPQPEIKVEKIDEALEGKEVKLMLNGALILSPIKGKDISKLAVGDRIMISIIDKSPKAIELAKAFKAYDEEGNMKPIPGRIISLKKDDYLQIIAIVAKGIYMKIVEEEENIKVAMDPVYYNPSKAKEEEEGTGTSKTFIIVLTTIFIVLVGIIVAFVLSL
ncbi:MAG TPA: hypothetical protein PLW88_05835 [Syntrophorhabdaceae bacterium]|nr:hypothetical protein [Syntrophorhabdaceae bacterium]